MKMTRLRPLMVVAVLLSTAACATHRPMTRWRPGIYNYRSTLPGTGEVTGSIEVDDDGPMAVTSSVGPCDGRIEPTPRRARERQDGVLLSRTFLCGTEHRLSVALNRSGRPPIEGSISNERTESVYARGEPVCRRYETIQSEDGIERICVLWDDGPRWQPRTTGATARWELVTVPFAPRP